MNLTWHIVKKDFRRLRLPLALWVVVMVGRFIVCNRILHVVNDDADALQFKIETLGQMHNVLAGLQLFLGCLLVAALIHEDPLVGPRNWWVTRPITGARLLGAKLAGLVLFFWVLPVVIALPWWWYSGFDFRALGGAVISLGCSQAALTLLMLALAVLTANAARFVAAVLLLTFTWICFLIILMAHTPSATMGVIQTRALAGVVLALTVIGAVVVHQFLTRRSGRSWAIFTAGAILLLTLVSLWPWDWSAKIAWRGSEPPALAAVTVTTTGEVSFTKVGSNLDPSLVRMDLGFRYANLPADYSLNSGSVTGTLRWPDGMELKRNGWIQSYPVASAWRIMGLKSPAGVAPEQWQNTMQNRGETAMTLIPSSMAAKLRGQAPAWEGELQLTAYRGEVVAEVPFRVKEKGGRAGHRIQIMGIGRQENGGLVVDLAESFPSLPGDSLPIESMLPESRRGPPATYVLCSRDRTKFIPLKPFATKGTFVNSVVVVRSTFGLDAGQLVNPADPDWLDHAIVLKVAYWSVGTLVRRVHSDGLHETQFKNGHRLEPASKPVSGS